MATRDVNDFRLLRFCTERKERSQQIAGACELAFCESSNRRRAIRIFGHAFLLITNAQQCFIAKNVQFNLTTLTVPRTKIFDRKEYWT